jgi:hypothetical protein
MTTKSLELLCKTDHNSPASRPEFVDINLDEVTAAGTELLETEEQQAQIEEQGLRIANIWCFMSEWVH